MANGIVRTAEGWRGHHRRGWRAAAGRCVSMGCAVAPGLDPTDGDGKRRGLLGALRGRLQAAVGKRWAIDRGGRCADCFGYRNLSADRLGWFGQKRREKSSRVAPVFSMQGDVCRWQRMHSCPQVIAGTVRAHTLHEGWIAWLAQRVAHGSPDKPVPELLDCVLDTSNCARTSRCSISSRSLLCRWSAVPT